MKPYTKPLTPRARDRGAEPLFPLQGSQPPPRPAKLDALTTFHLYFDGAKPGADQ